MGEKGIKIGYWITTILFAAFMLFSGVMSFIVGVTNNVEVNQVMASLGYPMYVNIIIGLAKILGVIAILQNKFKVVKEWAYSGFAIDLIGAAMSYGFATGIMSALGILPFIILFVLTYVFWKKREALK